MAYAGQPSAANVPSMSLLAPTSWKAVTVGADRSLTLYDNAATDMAGQLQAAGARVSVLHAGNGSARRDNIRGALRGLGRQPGEACLVFVTSHGNTRGLQFQTEGGRTLSPSELDRMVDAECGDAPTVLILSGCHSGTYVTSRLTAPNRIVITASSRGRVSYGAKMSERHVNFDRCILKAMNEGATTWADVFARARACAAEREAWLGVSPSDPQASFGRNVAQLRLPGR
ncbi:MAG: C13 family peptidase [Reyranellaceae bacterium]